MLKMSKYVNCVGPLNATVLRFESPGEISVRLSVFDGPFSRLKDRINIFYNKNALNLQLAPTTSLHSGDTVAVFNNSCWCRAQIVGIHEEKYTLLLLDYARKVENVARGDLHLLDGEFIRENAYAFFCHLPRVDSTTGSQWHPAVIEEMKRLIAQYGDEVQVVRLGPMQLTTDAANYSIKSLPVEIIWTYEEPDNPFAPNKTKQISLSAKLNRIHFAVTVEYLADEEHIEPCDDDDIPASATELANKDIIDDSDECEGCDSKEVEEKEVDDGNKFRWLDPEIPEDLQFRGRCTHVDDSGQIYLHLYENRSTMRIIRELLQDKYRGIKKSSKEKFEEGQECIARYTDGLWHRGRVVEVTDDKSGVLFVDYGNTSIVENKYIKSSLYCKENPIQALRVVLGNVKPWNGTDYSPETLDFIQQKLFYDQPGGKRIVHVNVIGSNRSLPLQVTISIPPTSEDGVWIDLGDLLIRSGDAVSVDKLRPSPELVQTWKKLAYGVGFVKQGTYDKAKPKFVQEANKSKPNSLYSKQLFPAFELSDVSVGDIIEFQLVEVLSHKKILVYPTKDNSGSQLSCLANQYKEMMEVLKAKGDDMPPIIHATAGLPVAVRYHGDKVGWFRGVIEQRSAGKYLVQYVDFGPQTYLLDSRQVKELPKECLSVPVAGLELILSINPQEEDDVDFDTMKMREVLCSLGSKLNDQTILKVKIMNVKPQLTGHMVSSKQLFPKLELDEISVGDLIGFQLIEVVSYNNVLVFPIKDNSGSQLSRLADQYIEMIKLLQSKADEMPPITHATEGLPVAAKFSRKDKTEWLRGVIQQQSAEQFLVQYVDYGSKTYWLEKDQVKELPKQCLSVPVAAIELLLPVYPASKEEEDVDLANAMMMEVLYSLGTKFGETFLKVNISEVKPQLAGHIIGHGDGDPVYKCLEKEGLIVLKM